MEEPHDTYTLSHLSLYKSHVLGIGCDLDLGVHRQTEMSHIAVERKRRRQMNDHLKVLRSLTPNFYIKRGDQASIISGAIEYIKGLHLVLHSLEIQQQEQTRTGAALSCEHNTTTHSTTRWINPGSGPTSAPAAAAFAASTERSRRQPLPSTSSLFTPPAPDIISTPSVVPPSSAHNNYSKLLVSDDDDHDFLLYCCNNSSSSSNNMIGAGSGGINVVSKEVDAYSCISPVADVEAKISGANILLTTLTKRKPLGQLINIITTLETLSLDVLHLNISTMDDTVLYSFIVKIGLDCPLSIEEFVMEVQQSFFCFDSAAY